MEPAAASPVHLGAGRGDEALQRLRAEIVRLEEELAAIEGAMAEVTRSGAAPPRAEMHRLSEHLATEVGVEAVARERAEMQRFLEAADDVARARVIEARNEADTVLSAARDDVTRAAEERAAAVAQALDSATAPQAEVEPTAPSEAGDATLDGATEEATTDASASDLAGSSTAGSDRAATDVDDATSAMSDRAEPAGAIDDVPAATGRTTPRRSPGARVLSALLWIVGTALVVVALAVAIAVVLAVLN